LRLSSREELLSTKQYPHSSNIWGQETLEAVGIL
jgi:hypothetical protein